MMKNKHVKAVILAVLGLIIWIVLVKVANPGKQTDNPVAQIPAVTTDQLQMEWREVVTEGVSNDETDRIEKFIDTFESTIAQRDSEKVLSFFSAPETEDEQDELDFILWRDVDPDSKQRSRLFLTAGYNFRYGAHYVRNVSAQGANWRVIVDEMRIIPSGGEWAGTVANVSRLVVELRTTSHGYQITHYYHEGKSGKYEGFVAE